MQLPADTLAPQPERPELTTMAEPALTPAPAAATAPTPVTWEAPPLALAPAAWTAPSPVRIADPALELAPLAGLSLIAVPFGMDVAESGETQMPALRPETRAEPAPQDAPAAVMDPMGVADADPAETEAPEAVTAPVAVAMQLPALAEAPAAENEVTVAAATVAIAMNDGRGR